MQKFLFSLALVASLSANYDDRKGEDFETSFGTVQRASNRLSLTEKDGTKHVVRQAGQLMFKAESTIGGVTLRKKLLLSHAMTRQEMVQALAAYMGTESADEDDRSIAGTTIPSAGAYGGYYADESSYMSDENEA